MKISWDEA
jgi:transposase